MREFKGEWRDIFKLFPVFLDPRKLLFALTGLLLTVLVIGVFTYIWALSFSTAENITYVQVGNEIVKAQDGKEIVKPVFDLPKAITPDALIGWYMRYTGFIFTYTPFYSSISYVAIAAILFFLIWAYFGGAICRSAAYEIAKDGERLESDKVVKFVNKRFGGFFMPPVICVIGFAFLYLINFVSAFVLKLIDLGLTALNVGHFGAVLGALLLFLCLIAGFVMTLIFIGSIFGLPLFKPAIAVEGTEAFDSVSRGFAYVFSKPFHFIWYQLVAGAYGYICVAFVFIVTVALCYFGVNSAANGFSFAWKDKGDFHEVENFAWSRVLREKYNNDNYAVGWTNAGDYLPNPHPYGRLMNIANNIARPDFNAPTPKSRLFKISGYVVTFWLILALGFAYASAISFFFASQTLIYLILRKKVDDIDINEIYPEEDEEELAVEETSPESNKEEQKKEEQTTNK